MEELEELAAPSLPLGISVPCSIILLIVAIYASRRLRYPPATLVLFACWLRYVASIFHQFTFNNSPLGPTWMALISLSIVAIGLWIIKPRYLKLKMLLPFYLLLIVAFCSAAANNSFANLTITVTKLGYLIVVMLCTFEALSKLGEKFLTWLLVAFLPPFVFQLISVLIGQTKSGEIDGSVSYVGGYNHEGAISIVMCTGILVAGLSRSMSGWLKAATIISGFIGVILADYRTTVLAFTPFLLICVITGPMLRLRAPQRAMVFLAFVGMLLGGVAVSSDKIWERYSDLAELTALPTYLQRDPQDFNREDQQIFSGRAYLWARYLGAWRNGPPHYKMIGAGPEARIPTKDRYPHNTLVSAVFEYGYIGLFTYLILLITPAIASLGAAKIDRIRLVTAHCSFFALNMATMPLWQIEGNIMYGLLCGYTMYAIQKASRSASHTSGFTTSP